MQPSDTESSTHSGLGRQFGRPSGPVGWLIGQYMARRGADMYRACVEVLDVQPEDQVLEIGFGPGVGIAMLAARATRGQVTGVDLSELMVKQAAKRNRRLIERGSVVLRQGSVSQLPLEDGVFTKACAVNSFHHWSGPLEDLKEVRRVMGDGGLLCLGLRMKHPTGKRFVPPGFTESEIEEVLAVVRGAGFNDVRQERRRLEREVVCVLAKK